ncbi:MAG: DUF5829 family protein [Panacibacter sp.]
MKIFIVCLAMYLIICPYAEAQNKLPEIYLSHMFIVLDSITYRHLFDSAFIKEQLGTTRTDSVTTSEESWFGKYLNGRNGYFEFFPPNGFKDATVGNIGFGFMTYTSGDIWKIKNNRVVNDNDTLKADTTNYVSKGVSYPWYYAIYISDKDSAPPLSLWIMENTPELLKEIGFSDEELKSKITWQDYIEKQSKKKSDQSFNRISSVELSVNKEEYEYLKKSLLSFGFKQKDNFFYTDDMQITYNISLNPAMRVKTIETELTAQFPMRVIKISDKLTLQVKGNKAVWKFEN